MRIETLKDLLAGIVFVLIQVLLFQHLSLFGATPDLLLVYLLWLALKYDRIHLILFAAGLGLLQDALFDFWGLHMFSKTLVCFMAFRIIHRNSATKLLIWQVFASVFAVSFFHNIIFLGISSFIDTYSVGFHPIIFLFLNSLYTATIGSILFVFKGN